MSNLRNILRFGWPYLRRYLSRMIAGIVIGVLFGITNAIILGSADMVMKRLSDPKPEAAASPTLPKLGFVQEWTDRSKAWKAEVLTRLDPWLPLKGRKMDGQQMFGVLLLFPALMALRGYLGFLSSYCLGWVSQRVVNDLQVDVLAKLQSLSLDFFNRARLGDLTMRIHGDTAALQRSLDEGLGDLIKQPVTIIAVFCFLLFKDPAMTLFLMLLLPFCLAPVIILGKKARKAATRGVQTKVSQANLLIEALAGIRMVKAFGLEGQQLGRFQNYARDMVRHGVKGLQAKEMINPIIETVTAFIFGLLIVLLFRSGRDWDDMMLFIAGLVTVYTPLKSLTRVHMIFQQSHAGVERMAQILDEVPSVREASAATPLAPFQKGIHFEDVSFAYQQSPVLERVTIDIPRGQRLGLAGESGSGKSTLLNLLFRFYDPTSGRVTIDGVDIRTVKTSSLRSQMALVSQEIVLFDQTVAENIAHGKEGATREEIESAARAAFAHEFISRLPHGYDTQIGERGVTLSGGQRQRVAIARAFIRNAPILVLDEATASLDSQAESEVQRAIDVLAEHRTVICVAHRLSTLVNLDRIIVLERGRIVQDGTFEELVRQDGPFSRMARKQGILSENLST